MNALAFIVRFIAGSVFMGFIAFGALVTACLGMLIDFLSAAWLVVVIGKVRKF